MQRIPEVAYPRSPYIAQRETKDEGFSQGWGFHFPPSESYWVDCHVHLRAGNTFAEITDALNRWYRHAEAYRLGRLVGFVEDEETFAICGAIASVDPRFSWFYWPKPDRTLADVQRAFAHGAVGLKLHNHNAMRGLFDPAIWESPQWAEVFAFLNERRAAVNWHVTQRVAYSPYHGGGDNAYWSEGIPNGVTFTNRDLLAQFLRIAEANPQLTMIGAHQLYLSNAALAEIFTRHPNVHVDTSVGYYLRWADTLQEADREEYRRFVLAHGDRLLFGTDTVLGVASAEDPYLLEAYKCHARFISALQLPFETLQAISHGNIERLLNLPAGSEARRYSARP